jgi:glutamate-1-semialdehyde 2,1-aminomutase
MPEEPGVIVRGEGCRVWDADGREFIDYRGGLGPVTLGYRFPAVDEAIRRQLESGIVFGQPHPVEGEVAEIICEVIPCAERARFLKTGGEAVAACIKLARYHTGRDHVVQVGYNGWLNSLAPGTRAVPSLKTSGTPPGVPRALSELHRTASWGDVAGLERVFDEWGAKIAALVIASDYDNIERGKGFYEAARELTQRHDAVLVYDEIVTGFRVALGGVQEHFGVVPDLAVFAKGVANGMPLSVYCGRAEIMDKLDKAIVSSTYGGDALSLAAAKATIQTYTSQDVIGHLWEKGRRLADGLNGMFRGQSVPIECRGYMCCPTFCLLEGAPRELAARFFRACYGHGVSFYQTSYPTFSHQDADVDETIERVEEALKTL